MASSLWRKWFGARHEPPAHLRGAIDEVGKLARDRPSLQQSCKTLGILLVELFAEPVAAEPFVLTPDVAHARLAEGVPMLRGEALSLDEKGVRARAQAVCDALQHQDAEAVAENLRQKKLDPLLLLNEMLAGRPDAILTQAEMRGIDAVQLATVLRLAALPPLSQIADALANLRQGISWDYGYCPTCGSWPLLAEARGLDQLRYLRCGLCATAWKGSRFRCVYCANQDHHSLGYFHVEGEQDRLRAATCDECHGYVKVISTLSAFSAPQLLIADLASLHLDLAAANRGFFVPAVDG